MDASLILVTGTPGQGKTLHALQLAIELVIGRSTSGMTTDEIKAALAAASRPLVLIGVEGADQGVFQTAESPMEWQDFPDGTVFVVDEVWQWWGDHQAAKIKNDQRVLDLAVHRHRGMTFILTSQAPTQVLEHVKVLANKHLHVTRKFGTYLTVIYEWPTVTGSPNSQSQRKLAQTKDWKHPPNIFPLYRSATMHTIKPKIPAKLIAALAIIPVCLALLGWGGVAISNIGGEAIPEAAAPEAAVGGSGGPRTAILSPEQYLAQFQPRIESQPWSAPIYDGNAPPSVPRVFCMSTETSCNCMTEQGTRYVLPMYKCRILARWGQYEPFLVSGDDQNDRRDRNGDRSGADSPVSAGAAVSAVAGAAGSPAKVGTGQEGQVW